MILKALAKINLGLKICYLREDGYHEIESVMQQICLFDYLVFEKEPENIDIKCMGLKIPLQSNIIYKTALELRQRYGLSDGIKIKLYKNIPVGAGLAGGSADAAATLLALNRLWELNLSFNELLEVGESIGADVPYCLLGGTALAKGKGEKLTPLKRLPFFGVVLAKPPGLSLSTSEVYKKYSDSLSHNAFTYDHLIESINAGDKKAISQWLIEQKNLNMLEGVVLRDNQTVNNLKKSFFKLNLFPIMSGSGPSVFALTACIKTAREAAARLGQEGYDSWVSWTI